MADHGILKVGVPQRCSECGSNLRYIGLGEYECTECKNIEYDDYGKVRSYLEKHRGASQSDVSFATGVPANRIRQLLQEERIEVTADSAIYLHCEMCGERIRSGRRCAKCEAEHNKVLDAEKKANRVSANYSGHGKIQEKAPGEMRFIVK